MMLDLPPFKSFRSLFLRANRKKDFAGPIGHPSDKLIHFSLNCKKDFAAFSLVEITLAIGIMAFCLVAMMGLLPLGLRQERTSSEQLLALQLLSATASDFRASETSQDLSKGSANTIRYAIKIPQIGGAPETGSFFASENFEKLDTPSGGAFQVQYTVKPPLTRLSGYQLHLFVSWNPNAKTPYTLTTLKDKDFVETVVTRTL